MDHSPGKRLVREIYVATDSKCFIALARAALEGKAVDLEELGFEKVRAQARHLKTEVGVFRFSCKDHRVNSFQTATGELIANGGAQ